MNNDNSKRQKNRVIARADTCFARYKGAFGDLLHQTVLPIFAMSNNNIVPLGTGFIIVPSGIMMTARHVVEDFVDKKEIRDSNEPIENFGLFAIYASDKKNDKTSILSNCYIGGPIRITKVYADVNLDIALCQLQLMQKVDTGEQLQYPAVRLNFSVPQLGMKILGVGYSGSQFSQSTYIKKESALLDV
jgi:S1-C subfamily serine protease